VKFQIRTDQHTDRHQQPKLQAESRFIYLPLQFSGVPEQSKHCHARGSRQATADVFLGPRLFSKTLYKNVLLHNRLRRLLGSERPHRRETWRILHGPGLFRPGDEPVVRLESQRLAQHQVASSSETFVMSSEFQARRQVPESGRSIATRQNIKVVSSQEIRHNDRVQHWGTCTLQARQCQLNRPFSILTTQEE
jgi:hypothetical protein